MSTVAIVATNGFEQSELLQPKIALEGAGHEVKIVSPETGSIQGMDGKEWADSVSVDASVHEADATAYDALVLPGGVFNPDQLRTNEAAVRFVTHFIEHDKPIAAICHGPWTLINAGGVAGRRLTSWPSLQVDLENAGAVWEDKEMVHHGNLITSRNPGDLEAFNEELLTTLSNT